MNCIACGLLICVWGVVAEDPAVAQTPQLFTEPTAYVTFDEEAVLEPVRFKRGSILTINTEALLAVDKPTAFEINALAVRGQVVSLQPLQSGSADSRRWHGKFEAGQVTLVMRTGARRIGNQLVRQKIVVGTIRTRDGAVYQVRHVSGDQVVVRELDQKALPPESEPLIPAEEMVPAERDVKAAGPYEFSVAVFYTPKARDGEGGTSMIRAVIELAELETNQAFADSGVNARMKVVYSDMTRDNEAGGFSGMLSALQNRFDGRMDEVHLARDDYSADLVVLICEDDALCGLAYRMTTESPMFSRWAFSVVNRNCATGNYSFGHELGHNMGCCHDAANPSTDPIYPYAYGWHFRKEETQYRTIMAYEPGDRVPRYSNPDASYLGVPTGKAGKADNVRTINNTADTVSAFR